MLYAAGSIVKELYKLVDSLHVDSGCLEMVCIKLSAMLFHCVHVMTNGNTNVLHTVCSSVYILVQPCHVLHSIKYL